MKKKKTELFVNSPSSKRYSYFQLRSIRKFYNCFRFCKFLTARIISFFFKCILDFLLRFESGAEFLQSAR